MTITAEKRGLVPMRVAEHQDGMYRVHDRDCVIAAVAGLPDAQLFAAARLMVAALRRAVAKFERCLNDPLNPCWAGRPGDVVGRHWGVGEACEFCHAAAVLALVEGKP